MPRVGINYYPIVLNRSRVFIGGFAGVASQQLNTIYSITEYEPIGLKPRIIGIDFGDYNKAVFGYGVKMAYSYQVIKDRFNMGILFDYTKFDIETNTFEGIFMSGQVQLGFILF
jgi:hypothetical protein